MLRTFCPRGTRPTQYLLSSVLDMTFWLSTTRQSKQRRRKVSCPQHRFLVRKPENKLKKTTYMLCTRVDVKDEFRIDHGAPKRSFWVLVMWKEEARDFSVRIVPVDLQQYEEQKGLRKHHRRTIKTICSLVSRLVRTISKTLTPSDFSVTQ